MGATRRRTRRARCNQLATHRIDWISQKLRLAEIPRLNQERLKKLSESRKYSMRRRDGAAAVPQIISNQNESFQIPDKRFACPRPRFLHPTHENEDINRARARAVVYESTAKLIN